MTNPLLTMEGLPPFSQIRPEHVKPAIEQAIADCKQRIVDVLQQSDSYTWDSLVAPLEEVDDKLSRIWSPVSHMNSVVNSDELRAAHDGCLPLLSEYQTFVGQHEGLYQAFQQLAASDEYPRRHKTLFHWHWSAVLRGSPNQFPTCGSAPAVVRASLGLMR